MPITILDGILLVIMLISALLAMIRGFVREVLSIAAWIAAAVAAFTFYDDLLPYVQQHIAQKTIAMAASAGGIFLVTLMVVSFITMRISDFVLDSRIGPLDRTVGLIFGAARGLLLVVVGLLFFNWFIPDENAQPGWVSGAKSKPVLEAIGTRLLAALPEDPEKEILEQFKNPLREDAPDGAPSDSGAVEGDPAYQNTERDGLDQLIQSTEPPKQ